MSIPPGIALLCPNHHTDDQLQDAAAATVAPHASDREQDFEDIQEKLLHSLRKPPEDHNWSANYSKSEEIALDEYIKEFYNSRSD